MMNIPFSPPDISNIEIEEVVDTLKSGWITTGPKTKLFEQKIAQYINTSKAVALNSATAAMELTLRLLGIGEQDEVITSAYTYTASASVIQHVGAKIVLVDTAKDSYHMDIEQLEKAITKKTKAIIPVDIAGVMCDYDEIFKVVEEKKSLFYPENDVQNCINRVSVIADAAHSFGSSYKGRKSGEVADFTCFSFHAVKNLTTAEGGAVTWRKGFGIDDELYKQFMLLSLHGQSKDALEKTKVGSWEYDILYPGFKYNMTDIQAAIGLAQLKRYSGLIQRRKQIINIYEDELKNLSVQTLKHEGNDFCSNGHLYMVRLLGMNEKQRNHVIEQMAQKGVSTNVHFKPLPLLTAYRNLGFNIKEFPNAYEMYKNEITLPLHTKLTDEQVKYVVGCLKDVIGRQ